MIMIVYWNGDAENMPFIAALGGSGSASYKKICAKCHTELPWETIEIYCVKCRVFDNLVKILDY